MNPSNICPKMIPFDVSITFDQIPLPGKLISFCDECNVSGLEKKVLICSGCKINTYCGKECATKNWKKEHSKICQINKEKGEIDKALVFVLNKVNQLDLLKKADEKKISFYNEQRDSYVIDFYKKCSRSGNEAHLDLIATQELVVAHDKTRLICFTSFIALKLKSKENLEKKIESIFSWGRKINILDASTHRFIVVQLFSNKHWQSGHKYALENINDEKDLDRLLGLGIQYALKNKNCERASKILKFIKKEETRLYYQNLIAKSKIIFDKRNTNK